MSNLDFNLRSSDLSQFSELKEQLLVSGPLASTVTDVSAVLTADQIRAARDGILFLDAATNIELVVGADTAANAADLQSILGLSQAGDQCLLTFGTISEDIGANIDLSNNSGTHVFVDIDLHSAGADADTQVLFNSAVSVGVASSLAIVRVTAENVTAGAEVILFDILIQGRVSA